MAQGHHKKMYDKAQERKKNTEHKEEWSEV